MIVRASVWLYVISVLT